MEIKENFMRIGLSQILLILLMTSCIEPPSNSRSEKNDNPRQDQRNGQTCSNCQILLENLPDQTYRKKGFKKLSYLEMQKALQKNKRPEDFYFIPNPTVNNERQIGQSAKDYQDCGHLDQLASIQARANHCFNVNDSSSFWSGQDNGISGEADWKLIYSHQETGVLLWQNTRTHLLWSHIVKNTDWEEASGFNTEDEASICQSLKFYTADQVLWKLPNRNEFLMADISGARFVLNDTHQYFWTASSLENEDKAWAIEQSTGILKAVDKTMPLEVRCLGVVKK